MLLFLLRNQRRHRAKALLFLLLVLGLVQVPEQSEACFARRPQAPVVHRIDGDIFINCEGGTCRVKVDDRDVETLCKMNCDLGNMFGGLFTEDQCSETCVPKAGSSVYNPESIYKKLKDGLSMISFSGGGGDANTDPEEAIPGTYNSRWTMDGDCSSIAPKFHSVHNSILQAKCSSLESSVTLRLNSVHNSVVKLYFNSVQKSDILIDLSSIHNSNVIISFSSVSNSDVRINFQSIHNCNAAPKFTSIQGATIDVDYRSIHNSNPAPTFVSINKGKYNHELRSIRNSNPAPTYTSGIGKMPRPLPSKTWSVMLLLAASLCPILIL